MRIDITTDAARLLNDTESFLRRDPLRHTVIATVLVNRINGRSGAMETQFLSVRDSAGVVVGIAQCTNGAVYLGELPAHSISAVADAFLAHGIVLRSVEGDNADAAAFAAHWSAVGGGTFCEKYSTRLFGLGELSTPEAVGAPRQAVVDDVALVIEMIEAFGVEADVSHRLDEAAVRKRIEAGTTWLWEHDATPVTLVARHAAVFGWARIGPVYTPPRFRGNGFASALTATVASRIRAEGADACLFTDLANPTSNKIYQRIGFEPVRDFVHYALTDQPIGT
ncbi:GNAT family N-acetyltransferase [Nocardia sp. NPDC058658]|uniref:GNAT family N-acetyltransferase n=1 Tax=Nocardia sp. NPDC058658 TaxID=3346580 RepID=UPI00365BDB62